ncbi:MAG TPA: response regulator [Verrucomicrobiae bacterium]|jgi:DNA-binding response OmpR family regulator|nr:response regulator [Verrucomicrobiae bacterium]
MKVKTISQTPEAARAPLQRPVKPSHRILVVEDDRDIRQLNTEALTQCGYHVDAAKDGADAWDTLQASGYDLMVTDNDMPKVTGVDLLKKLHAAHLALPVIMATGILPEAEFTRYPWLQPAAMLIKPYTIDELVATVRQVLRVTDSSGDQTAPPAPWQNQLPAEGWLL